MDMIIEYLNVHGLKQTLSVLSAEAQLETTVPLLQGFEKSKATLLESLASDLHPSGQDFSRKKHTRASHWQETSSLDETSDKLESESEFLTSDRSVTPTGMQQLDYTEPVV